MCLIFLYYGRMVGHVSAHEKALREQAKKMNVESLRSNANANAQSAEIRIAKVYLIFSDTKINFKPKLSFIIISHHLSNKF